jgi:carotenoid cleavage dioxygenase-like enzyme
MSDFSKMPAMKGFFAPMRFEADVLDCEVVGNVPSDLRGAFVRLGGDWFYPPKDPGDSPFSQDGYISTFRFRNGLVDFKGRWVRTPRFEANRAANRQLFGNYRNPFTDESSVAGRDRTVANTTPQAFAGKLFALKEDSLPYEIDPKTLGTLGPYDFDGKYRSQTFSAHPKVDPVSGEMIAYGYEATGLLSDDLFLYTIDKSGRVTREVRLKLPYVSMVHDIAVTQKHVIIPVHGFVTSIERLKAGKVHWGWDGAAPTYYGVIPRDGEARDLRWFKGPTRAIVHTFNAHSEGDQVILEAPTFDGTPFPFFPPIDGSAWDPSKARAMIRRVTFDLGSKRDDYREEILYQQPLANDLVRIDPRYVSLRHRYGYVGYADRSKPFDEARGGNLRGRVTNCYGRYDFSTGNLETMFAGDTHSLQECCFVPRRKDAPEGDGYLLGVASNYGDMRSELLIADAQRLAEGPIARVILPFRSTAQVHGVWVNDDEVPM